MKRLAQQVSDPGVAASRRPVTRRSSFTLIELLVVVAVIMVLVGITLKVMGMVNRRSASAKTLAIIEQVKHALGEYYSTYGSYPPGDMYNSADHFTSVDYVHPPDSTIASYPSCNNWHSSTGLVYYLKYFDQPPSRWTQFTDGIVPNSSGAIATNSQYQGGTTPTYTNTTETIVDGWGNKLRYVSSVTNGYQSYSIWSIGPNGIDEGGTNDDIGVQWAE